MIYIIGKSGNIGRSLADYFYSIEIDTTGIGRDDDLPEFREEDVIINCAQHGWEAHQSNEWGDMVRTNVMLPMELDKKRNGANIIHLSTGFELIPEMMKQGYALTKRMATEYLQGKAHIVYLYTVFGGLYDPPYRFIRSLINSAINGTKYTCTSPFSTRDFVHISRLMPLIETLSHSKEYQTVQFGTGYPRTLAQVVGTLEGIIGHTMGVEMKYVDAAYFRYAADEPYLKDDHFVRDLKKEHTDTYMRFLGNGGTL